MSPSLPCLNSQPEIVTGDVDDRFGDSNVEVEDVDDDEGLPVEERRA